MQMDCVQFESLVYDVEDRNTENGQKVNHKNGLKFVKKFLKKGF